MTTNLVVADPSRTEKTICLAVSPSLKSYGIPGRPRLFEVVQKVREVNNLRRQNAPGRKLSGSSCQDTELKKNPSLAADYITAPPQMAHYMELSAEIYKVYLKYIAPEDMHVYSIDEVFIDATGYLNTWNMTARELAMKMILDVLSPPASRPLPALEPIFILQKPPWILKPNISRPMKTAFESRNSTRCPTGALSGLTALLPTSGVSAKAMPESLKNRYIHHGRYRPVFFGTSGRILQ